VKEVSVSQVSVPSSDSWDSADAETAGLVTSYRRMRDQIEREVLSRATSVDGLRFTCQASLHNLRLCRGGYVVLEAGGRQRLGQVTDLRVDRQAAAVEGLTGHAAGILVRMAGGSGVLLDTDGDPFHDAAIRPAQADEVAMWARRTRPRRAGLEIGELALAPGVPAILDSGGLGRHTFMCGQSGSGKTYALGLLLERVLAETTIRIVVLDPNSDYVRLAHVREGAHPLLTARYARVTDDVAVWRDDPQADRPLRLRFVDLDSSTQAAVLGLDPVGDREEYAALGELLRLQKDGEPLISDIEQLADSDLPGARALGLRARNIGLFDWSIWDPQRPSLVAELRDPTARCTVVDLGSLGTAAEQRLVAQAVLSTLWRSRHSREPCLVVVDEAHNICSADPRDEVGRLSTDTVVQIAAEGRKYGLYLLTSTQRPNKVHENVVSQCDNLLLMRMNSEADLTDLGRLFSFVPPGLVAGATSFRMGQALVAGRVLPHAAYVQMGVRVSEEGGADVPAVWATPRPS
jgi:DNA helicase HerA-like ATPase